MASPKALQEWCRVSCAGYSEVEVKDWSSSFRSGLAFCAIIHKHRPELLDFCSLSKDNAYENNKMAFELVETKLGVPMLLDAGEIGSVPEPDRLAVITCLFQFYLLFNRKSKDLASLKSLHDILNSSTKSPENSKSLTHSEFAGKYSSLHTKPQVTCNVCLKPVHLIQGRVVCGKSFRCRRCHFSLLHDTSGGSAADSLMCSHHGARTSTQTDARGGYLSLSGLAVSSVPRYAAHGDGGTTLSAGKESGCDDGRGEVGIAPGDTGSNSGAGGEGGGHRVTAHGATSSPNMTTSATQGTADKTTGAPAVVTHRGSGLPTRGSCRVRTNHPWMKIVHPGPWTQLPPAPPLSHPLRSKSVSSVSGAWSRRSAPAPNPFDEEEDKTTPRNPEEIVGVAAQKKQLNDVILEEEKEGTCTGNSDLGLEVQTNAASTSEAQSHAEEPPCPTLTANEDSTLKCEFTEELSCHSPAFPTKGFPLIKRKVQTDRSSPSDDLQQQIAQVAKHLEALEEKGVELERDIRRCTNSKEEEKLLMDWFALIYQKHMLEQKDKALVYLLKQQELEQRQEDVEYKLRCLLNRPEREWSERDQRQEQQLMEELLHIIDQRNQIISRLDQDVQREREDGVNWETMVKNKDIQKCELKELKKSKGKFKTTSVFKILKQSKRENKS